MKMLLMVKGNELPNGANPLYVQVELPTEPMTLAQWDYFVKSAGEELARYLSLNGRIVE